MDGDERGEASATSTGRGMARDLEEHLGAVFWCKTSLQLDATAPSWTQQGRHLQSITTVVDEGDGKSVKGGEGEARRSSSPSSSSLRCILTAQDFCGTTAATHRKHNIGPSDDVGLNNFVSAPTTPRTVNTAGRDALVGSSSHKDEPQLREVFCRVLAHSSSPSAAEVSTGAAAATAAAGDIRRDLPNMTDARGNADTASPPGIIARSAAEVVEVNVGNARAVSAAVNTAATILSAAQRQHTEADTVMSGVSGCWGNTRIASLREALGRMYDGLAIDVRSSQRHPQASEAFSCATGGGGGAAAAVADGTTNSDSNRIDSKYRSLGSGDQNASQYAGTPPHRNTTDSAIESKVLVGVDYTNAAVGADPPPGTGSALLGEDGVNTLGSDGLSPKPRKAELGVRGKQTKGLPLEHGIGGEAGGGRRRALSLTACRRLHAGLIPLLSPLVVSDERAFLLFSCLRFRLTSFTQLHGGLRGTAGLAPSPPTAEVRRDRDAVDLLIRFVFYQLLRTVDFLHSRGIAIGNLRSSNVFLTRRLWVQIAPSISPLLRGNTARVVNSSPVAPATGEVVQPDNLQKRRPRGLGALARLSSRWRQTPGEDLPLTYRWVKGMVSNLEYLMAVNAAAGRLLGDHSCYPIVPWVSDLLERVDGARGAGGSGDGQGGRGWRDLTMTKFRLKKGDAQLDKSYAEANPPHHIPESLSELTLTVYLARRLPLQILRDVVRSEFVPQEYPSSIARMYSWTPDECVPEFYTDPGVFRSAHKNARGLPDLEVPPWCNGSPEEFVKYHRSLLESDRVSRDLHRWLDLTFGFCLKGQAAADNKNVPLLDSRTACQGRAGQGVMLSDKSSGFVQLFRHPHPPRRVDSAACPPIASVPECTASSATLQPSREADTKAAVTAPVVPVEYVKESTARSGTGVAAKAKRSSSEKSTRGSGGFADGGFIQAVRSPAAKLGNNEGGGSVVKDTGKGGGASIFGVAFDDYIGEDGVRALPGTIDRAEAEIVGRESRLQDGGHSDGNAGRIRDMPTGLQEDRRALAFAHDVDLRLRPWYGRPQHNPDMNSTVTEGMVAESVGQRGDGGCGADVGGDGHRHISRAADDLLACGCILAEICAGEPVLSGFTVMANSPGATRRRNSDAEIDSGVGAGGWLDSAMYLPTALRGAIGALTHVDPSKRPTAQELLATTEPDQPLMASGASGKSWTDISDGRRRGTLLPPSSSDYRGLFPPYMRDVYAFLAALHQEETAHKRLLLAAAALPVLQVPLPAYFLVVPHLVALLEPTPSVSASMAAGRDRRAEFKVAATAGAGELSRHAQSWVSVLDLSSARLGPELAVNHLLPTVLLTLEGIRSPELACHLMEAGLWGILARRFGAGVFLRSVFPVLLTWVDRGVYGALHRLDDHIVDDNHYRGGGRGSSAQSSGVYQDEGGEFCWPQSSEATVATETEAGSRVQVAAAAAVSCEVYEYLGPTLASRYLIPAMVDCLGRLASTAATVAVSSTWSPRGQSGNVDVTSPFSSVQSSFSTCAQPSSFEPTKTNKTDELQKAGPPSAEPSALAGTRMASGVRESRRTRRRDLKNADPASYALLLDCWRTKISAGRVAKGDPFGSGADPGLGGEGGDEEGIPAPLLLSRALGDMCLKIGSEEVTVPFVLNRVFAHILPSLEPVLTQTGGPSNSATGFRSVLEVTSLLVRLLPFLCPETIAHFYIGLRSAAQTPAAGSAATAAVVAPLSPMLEDCRGREPGGHGAPGFSEKVRVVATSPLSAGRGFGSGLRPAAAVAAAAIPDEVPSVPWMLLSMLLPEPLGGVDLPWSADVVATDGVTGLEDEALSGGNTLSGGDASGDDELQYAYRGSGDHQCANGRGEDPLEEVAVGMDRREGDSLFEQDGGRILNTKMDWRQEPQTEAAKAAPTATVVADISLHFVCHVEVARLLAVTAMRVVGCGRRREEEGRVLLETGEAFFAAFNRSYGGLVFSSPTMVAALRLAREVHSPLASLFGLQAMRVRVPSASRRMVNWLSRETTIPTSPSAVVATARDSNGGDARSSFFPHPMTTLLDPIENSFATTASSTTEHGAGFSPESPPSLFFLPRAGGFTTNADGPHAFDAASPLALADGCSDLNSDKEDCRPCALPGVEGRTSQLSDKLRDAEHRHSRYLRRNLVEPIVHDVSDALEGEDLPHSPRVVVSPSTHDDEKWSAFGEGYHDGDNKHCPDSPLAQDTVRQKRRWPPKAVDGEERPAPASKGVMPSTERARRGNSRVDERSGIDGSEHGSTTGTPLLGRLHQALKTLMLKETGAATAPEAVSKAANSLSMRPFSKVDGGADDHMTVRQPTATTSSFGDRDDTSATITGRYYPDYFNGGTSIPVDAHRAMAKSEIATSSSYSNVRSPFGVPAWGKRGSTADVPDPLLPPPASTVPPPPTRSSDGRGRGEGAERDLRRGGGGGRGMDKTGGGSPSTRGRVHGGEIALPNDDTVLEWPSLLGAIGSKAPRSPSPPLFSNSGEGGRISPSRATPPVAHPPTSPPVAYVSIFSASQQSGEGECGSKDDDVGDPAGGGRVGPIRERQETRTAASPATSPPRSLRLEAASSALELPRADPPPPLLPQPRASLWLPPLPATCGGVGVDVAERLRERAWLAGTRTWGGGVAGAREGSVDDVWAATGNGTATEKGRQQLGYGFDREAVGALFRLNMTLQTSFLGYAGKAAVTSMAVETRSESILITGSSKGEVRVWSLRENPVARLGGFRCEDAGGSGKGGRDRASRPPCAVSQLGIFEGGMRGAALNGLIRVWDIERSKELAVCYQGAAGYASPLTAFALGACGQGLVPPFLHQSEYGEPAWEAAAAAMGTNGGGFGSPAGVADEQQLAATFDGGVVHYDFRQGSRQQGELASVLPVAHWNAEEILESLRSRSNSTHGARGDGPGGSTRRGAGGINGGGGGGGGVDSTSLSLGLCSICDRDGEWLATGSGGGQVVVFDKRRAGGRPLFWWNAHDGAVIGVFCVSRHGLVTVSRDQTAVMWDLSRSPSSDMAGIDSSYYSSSRPLRHYPTWGLSATGRTNSSDEYPRTETAGFSTGISGSRMRVYGETSPLCVYTAHGLPDNSPEMLPSTVLMLPFTHPAPRSRSANSARAATFAPQEKRTIDNRAKMWSSNFGVGNMSNVGAQDVGGSEMDAKEKLPVLFAAAGDVMVATVVRGGGSLGKKWAGSVDAVGNGKITEEVYSAGFVGPSGKRVYGGGGRRSSSGGLVVRSAAVLPLRRLVLLGCADGWIRVGT